MASVEVCLPTESSSRFEIAALLHEQFERLVRRLRMLELRAGMTSGRMSALSVIEECGRISVTALANKEMVKTATMSRMVAALVEEGLVKRSEDETDGRGVLVSATRRGRRAFQRAQEQRLQHFAAALDSLSDDQIAAMRNLRLGIEGLTRMLDKGAGS